MSYPRPEDYDAEEPEAAELDALRGRKEAAELDGPKDLVALLDNKNASVLIGAAPLALSGSLCTRGSHVALG